MTEDDDLPAGPGRSRKPAQRRTAVSAKLETAFNRFRGLPVETDLAAYARTVRKIRASHESEGLARTSERGDRAAWPRPLRRRLAARAARPTARIAGAARIEAFALVLEAARRATGLAAHDVQMIAGLAMADGKIAELPTGEGQDPGGRLYRRALRPLRPARPRPDLQRLPGPPRRGLDGAGLPASRSFRRRRPGGPGQAGEEGGLCLRRHLRHGQGGRIRLSARPAGLRAR